ncbi:MAG: hypothetical protein A2252_06480 [Elusimicrobia bacterium RIFOXYA2_FULL_39_19]|nr:MAG: hypothetical protein A2252_06480 [Elusimicrobia bacterium RIFOXYA2_FULL_39_19]
MKKTLSAFDYACKVLQNSAKTQKELIDKLAKKGFNNETINETLLKLKKYDYINDLKFTEEFIRKHIEAGEGCNLIKHKLIAKGIEDKQFDSAFLNMGLSEEKQYYFAETVFKKKLSLLKNLPKEKLYIKMGTFLENKGFQEEIIEKLLSKIK